jgi:hypothetical protein
MVHGSCPFPDFNNTPALTVVDLPGEEPDGLAIKDEAVVLDLERARFQCAGDHRQQEEEHWPHGPGGLGPGVPDLWDGPRVRREGAREGSPRNVPGLGDEGFVRRVLQRIGSWLNQAQATVIQKKGPYLEQIPMLLMRARRADCGELRGMATGNQSHSPRGRTCDVGSLTMTLGADVQYVIIVRCQMFVPSERFSAGSGTSLASRALHSDFLKI